VTGRQIALDTQPRRIQRRRVKGWRAPHGAVYVGRGSRFGNPFTVAGALEWGGAETKAQATELCVRAFRSWLRGNRDWWMGPEADATRDRIAEGLPQLAGRDLMCWCPPGQACHADVLLELANGSSTP